MKSLFAAAALWLSVASSHAFTRRVNSNHNGVAITIGRDKVTALGPVAPEKIIDPFSYREQLRVSRRDFFTSESWLRHRSKERFLGTLFKMLESGLIRSLKDELIFGEQKNVEAAYLSL